MNTIQLKAKIYRGYDADFTLEVPADGYLGWDTRTVEINPEKTAVVVMHAWNVGTPEEYPGVFRANEYVLRSYEVCKKVFPELLETVRNSPLRLYHVVGGPDYYSSYPGYQYVLKTLKEYNEQHGIGAVQPKPDLCEPDDAYRKIKEMITYDASYGKHNMEDIHRSIKIRNFADEAMPIGDEPIAATTEELFALCKKEGINHLIYTGFALNCCLQVSPCGMVDMFRKGLICSVIEDATVAMETKESIRGEWNKHGQLYMISTLYGLIFRSKDVIGALKGL
ncbi:MAG: hypothetical protein ACOX3Q_04435 [Clostridia bacterium]|jgi:hypothetical protein|nr:cysteine hydrolase [Clostridiaceae bacterium]